jgi:hypothetical protein
LPPGGLGAALAAAPPRIQACQTSLIISGSAHENLRIINFTLCPPPTRRINGAYVDESGRPFVDIRILHTHVLLDPFPDPAPLAPLIPPASPVRTRPEEERLPERLSVEEAAGVEGAWGSKGLTGA